MAQKILTWNVNGLNSPHKRKKLFTLIQKERCDITCLQETHILEKHEKYLEQKKLGTLFSSSNKEKKQNGVALYIKPELQPMFLEKDQLGRWIIVQANIQAKKIIIMGIYAPNDNHRKQTFFQELSQKLLQFENHQLIIMGDFNAIHSPPLDKKMTRRKKTRSSASTLPKSFMDITDILELQDIWRRKNPFKSGFTFYSSRHASFSRIDMCWASTELLLHTKDIEILPKTLSDHNAILWSLKGSNKPRHWKLNSALWTDKTFLTEANKELITFFELNLTKDVPLKTVWDASKPYFRGFVIQYMAKLNKERRQKTTNILNRMKELEKDLLRDPRNDQRNKDLSNCRHELNLILTAEIAHKIKLARLNYIENANKPGRWLSYRLKKNRTQRLISMLKDKNGITQSDQTQIQRIIEDFYQKLFKQEEINKDSIYQYLEQAKFPKLNEEQRALTNAPISMMELTEAIRQQKGNKTPGPDGIPIEYYRNFSDILSINLKDLFTSILEGEDIPDSWKSSNITLIPKEGKPKDMIQNYRPIALLNVDYKIFATVLANRWRRILSSLIHHDQNGFLPRRHLQSNIRVLLNALEYYECHPQKQAAFVFIDAEKAFDNVSWSLIKTQLDYLQCGHRMLRAIEQIYSTQNTRVIVNGYLTDKVTIHKGTRQGCPLSPLLFILSLEILLHTIRNSDNIHGINVKGEIYKVQAYADDILLILEDPSISLIELLKTLETFSSISGFKINREKTTMLTKNITPSNIVKLVNMSGFQHVNKVKYLGITVTNRCNTLIDNNYVTVVKAIKTDLNTWSRLHLSLMGRIAAIKMAVLPKLLFVFQCLPVLPNLKILSDLEKCIRVFIWQKKKARIKNIYLQDRTKAGGFALPNLMLYYKAAAMTWIKDWILMSNDRIVRLEGHDLDKGWHHYLWYKGNLPTLFKRHWIRNALMKVWLPLKALFYTKAPGWLSPLEAILGPGANVSLKLPTYKQLLNNELSLKPLKQLLAEGFKIDWWNYQQIHSHFKNLIKEGGFMTNDNVFDKLLHSGDKKVLSKFYNLLLNEKSNEILVKDCMIKWAENLGYSLHLNKWDSLWNTVKLFKSISYKENCYKMFYRWYLSPHRLSKMYNCSSRCWKCKFDCGTFYHMWWSCKEANTYWKMVKLFIERALKIKLDFKPELFLLNIIDKNISFDQKYVLHHVIVAARILYAQFWKQSEVPTERNLHTKIRECIEIDRLSGYLKGDYDEIAKRRWQEVARILVN